MNDAGEIPYQFRIFSGSAGRISFIFQQYTMRQPDIFHQSWWGQKDAPARKIYAGLLWSA